MKKRYLLILCALLIQSIALSQEKQDQINRIDSNGLRQGTWEKYYPNGNLMYRGTFVDNNPAGIMKRYYESGELMAELNFRKDRKAFARIFYQNGQLASEGLYSGELRDSTWKYYSFYGGHLTQEESYILGKKQGISSKYYPDGRILEKVTWVEDHKAGSWIRYFPSGNLMLEAVYENDLLNGLYRLFNDDSVLIVSGTYIDDRKEGKWTYYQEDGKIRMTVHYEFGSALNKDELDRIELDYLDSLENLKGKFSEPEIDDLLPPEQIRKSPGSMQ